VTTIKIIYALDLFGVAVFAVSGALAAGHRGFDWVGVFILAILTAIGGGTLRDVLLDREIIFWIANPIYIQVILGAAAATLLYTRFFRPPYKSLLYADALGLALFSILGAQVAEATTSSATIIILMGAITGAAGGILRDLVLNEVPLLCRQSEPIYSVTAVAGIAVYLLAKHVSVSQDAALLLGVVVIAGLRIAAIRWQIRLPAFLPKQ
jgi:uncharacterized membrane protein YeiH